MSDKSMIEWTEATWNPVTGCSKVSQGCKHCYAERVWPRLSAMPDTAYTGRDFTDVQCHQERLQQPLRWKKPRMIFVNSMSDLFHESVPDAFIRDVFNVMAEAKQHTFQVLTKRPERMRDFMIGSTGAGIEAPPIPNIWFGVSVEDQATADERIPFLMETPANVRWASIEPMLGAVDLTEYLEFYTGSHIAFGLDWIVAGGESGPDARPSHPDWFRSIRDQCIDHDVPFFFKQWGEYIEDDQPTCRRCGCTQDHACPGGCSWIDGDLCSACEDLEDPTERPLNFIRVGKRAAGRLLDGFEHNDMPKVDI
jgi:protein gp37